VPILLVAIVLVVISAYSIGGYYISAYLLVPIGDYSISGYCGYFINGYWLLFYK
jgi:hypothetical protein